MGVNGYGVMWVRGGTNKVGFEVRREWLREVTLTWFQPMSRGPTPSIGVTPMIPQHPRHRKTERFPSLFSAFNDYLFLVSRKYLNYIECVNIFILNKSFIPGS
jgi:hypothetical protein